MKKIFFLFLAIMIFGFSGCGTVIRVSSISDGQWVETKTKKGEKTRTITTKKGGKVVGEVITTNRWDEEKKTVRPYKWEDRGYGYGYGRSGRYYR